MSDVKDGSDALGDEPRQHQTRTCAYIRGFNGCAGQAFTTSNQSVMTISTDVRPDAGATPARSGSGPQTSSQSPSPHLTRSN